MTCRISVRNLRKVYGVAAVEGNQHPPQWLLRLLGVEAGPRTSRAALEGLSFDIAEGERVGVIGENGAGKSTLLGILAGTIAATSGHMEVEGHVHAALTLGLSLREELTGRENLYLDGEVLGQTREQTDGILDQLIAFVELGDFIDRPVRTYSSGMKARLAFSSLVFTSPEILLIDETLSVGDIRFSAKASKAIRELCNRGKVVVVVSHGLDTILDLCTRCLWIDNGRLRADGEPRSVVDAYRDWVRRRDEEELTARFSTQERSTMDSGSSVIESVVAYTDTVSRPKYVFELGERLRLQARVRFGTAIIRRPTILLRVTRIDGIRVIELPRANDAHGMWNPSGGSWRIDVDLGPCELRPSLYRAEMEVLDNGIVVGAGFAVFKTIASELARGGEPIILRQARINGRLIAARSPALSSREVGST